MAKRPTTPFSHDAPPAVRQKLEIAEATGQSLATTLRSDPMNTLVLTDQQHKDLDCQIFKILENISQNDDWLGSMYMAICLTCRFSSGTLPAITIDDAQRLVREHGELEEVVREALESKSFRRIRNLEILRRWKGPSQDANQLRGVPMDRRQLSAEALAFQDPYRGSAVDGFYNYLKDNDRKFDYDNQYYAKFCNIVQSSGTGKSRLMCELSQKNILVLYINLREEKDESGFPARDTIPADILTHFTNEEDYTKKCHAFFAALFIGLREGISRDEDNVIQGWNDRMNQFGDDNCVLDRHNFFGQILTHYKDVYEEILESKSGGMRKMVSEFERAQTLLREKVGKKISGPILVIALDEAHTLTPTQKTWKPSTVFCRAIANFSRKSKGCWVVFASTTSKVADFAAPLTKYPSTRVAISGQLLFPPYTRLGWDQKAMPFDFIPVDEYAQVKYIAGFGRPLWTSIGEDPVRMLQLAEHKLCPRYKFAYDSTVDREDDDLAVLAQRFGLDVYFDHKDAVSFIETAIVSHARICLGTSENRMWSFTAYPSEPFLSCAAARVLHNSSQDRKAILGTLIKKVKIGLIEVGKTGELANRLLWLLAKDLLVRRTPSLRVPFLPLSGGADPSLESELADCIRIRVVDYLKYIFGESFWSTIAPIDAEDLFAKAYINFSHWVPMKSNIGKRKGISESEWMMRLWKRTCAIQCCHQQDLIDAMLPLYFDLPGLPLAQRLSQIFISVKLTGHSNCSQLNFITREDPSIDCTSGRPWIAILVDYDLKKSEVTANVTPGRTSGRLKAEGQVDDKCLRIYAAGMSPDTFKFLEHQELQVLQELVNFEKPIQEGSPVELHLQDQMEFGSAAEANHMVWEKQL